MHNTYIVFLNMLQVPSQNFHTRHIFNSLEQIACLARNYYRPGKQRQFLIYLFMIGISNYNTLLCFANTNVIRIMNVQKIG